MKRSKFNLTHTHSTTADAGQLIPFLLQPTLPGDRFRIGLKNFIRCQPMVAPLMHEVYFYTQYWYVPYRILWDNWEDFITGGGDLSASPSFPYVAAPSGGWQPGSLADYFGFPVKQAGIEVSAMPFRAYAEIWNTRYRDEDLQTDVGIVYTDGNDNKTNTDILSPSWKRDYFTLARPWTQRGADIMVPIVGTDSHLTQIHKHSIRFVAYTAPGVPDIFVNWGWPTNDNKDPGVLTDLAMDMYGDATITLGAAVDTYWWGSIPAGSYKATDSDNLNFRRLLFIILFGNDNGGFQGLPSDINADATILAELNSLIEQSLNLYSTSGRRILKTTKAFTRTYELKTIVISHLSVLLENSLLNDTVVDVAGSNNIPELTAHPYPDGVGGSPKSYLGYSSTSIFTEAVFYANLSIGGNFSVRDLRASSALQRYAERSLKFGNRYEEFIQREFGVKPRDSRIQRPEYLGGGRGILNISEVLQTAEGTDTSVGTMRGHGIASVAQRPIRFKSPEHGIIIGLLSIRPKAVYTQGIEREFLKRSRLDFFTPELANIGMQEVLTQELFATSANKDSIFGYNDRYQEYRFHKPLVTGEFRDTLNYWNMARIFDNAPNLNDEFINMEYSAEVFKRPFAVQDQSYHSFLIMLENVIHAWRPIPKRAKDILK